MRAPSDSMPHNRRPDASDANRPKEASLALAERSTRPCDAASVLNLDDQTWGARRQLPTGRFSKSGEGEKVQMTRFHSILFGLALGVGLVVATPSLEAQTTALPDPNRAQVTRAELTELLARVEAAQESDGYTLPFRDQAAAQTRLIRERLTEGDFQVGDQVVLSVRDEPALTATFTVRPGPQILLPNFGAVPLRGVLRSELEQHLTTHLTRFVRNPEVQAHALFNITVTGAVARPGYYVLPAQALVSEAIMSAGGFTPAADLERLRIVRGESVVWDGQDLQEAIAEGRTFDELSLEAGDAVVVPTRSAGGTFTSLRTLILSIPTVIVAITAIVRLF